MDHTSSSSSPVVDGSIASVAHHASRRGGGLVAASFSAIAMGFSGLSFYASVLRQPDLQAFVPPVIHYARDSGGDIELFAIPLTISNEGARSGTVLSMELEAEKAGGEKVTKRYYSAYLGEHPQYPGTSSRAFAPVSIAGRGVFTETVRFYPAGNPLPKLVDDAGEYKFTLKLNVASPTQPDIFDRLLRAKPQPISFELTLPWISEQQLDSRRATIPMHTKDWRPTSGSVAGK